MSDQTTIDFGDRVESKPGSDVPSQARGDGTSDASETREERVERGQPVAAKKAKKKHGTAIEWTQPPGYIGETWNPIRGCSVVSPGCAFCYAMKQAARIAKMQPNSSYNGLTKMGGKGPVWTGDVVEVPEYFDQPARWREPRCIFVNSMSDFAHDKVSRETQTALFDVMRHHPRHIYQLLTKRAENLRDFSRSYQARCPGAWPHAMRHVWLGVSVETADYKHRIDVLRDTPAAVRFLSIEPLIGPVGELNLEGIHWVIVGGESGDNARPMHPDWARSIRDQCKAAGVPFFFKQWGQWLAWEEGPAPFFDRVDGRSEDRHRLDYMDDNTCEMNPGWLDAGDGCPAGGSVLMYERMSSKKAAGRKLDGKLHNEWPAYLSQGG